MGMGRSDVLTEELHKLLLDIEYWLKDIYLDGCKIDSTTFSGQTLQDHKNWLYSISESLSLISSVLTKGYYTTDEKEVLNLLRESWLEEKKASYKV